MVQTVSQLYSKLITGLNFVDLLPICFKFRGSNLHHENLYTTKFNTLTVVRPDRILPRTDFGVTGQILRSFWKPQQNYPCLKCIPTILQGNLTTDRSPMSGEFDFQKGQIPTNSPSKPGRGVSIVGLNIDRHIIPTQEYSSTPRLYSPLLQWIIMVSCDHTAVQLVSRSAEARQSMVVAVNQITRLTPARELSRDGPYLRRYLAIKSSPVKIKSNYQII